MEKLLNINLITRRAEELGFTQTKLSELIGVSKEAVSQWFRGESYPRPAKLLKLGSILNLSYDEIVISDSIAEPVVAYRKVKGAKTKVEHIKYAKDIGFFLGKLVEYLPFETLTTPPTLKNPSIDFAYVQLAVSTLRKNFSIEGDFVNIQNILRSISMYKITLIPLLMGKEKNHENALHIFLEESGTNWVFINLDTSILDFKFWVLHEFAHILSPSLMDEEAEIFADAFAGAFLFPQELCKTTYNTLSKSRSAQSRVNYIFQLAEGLQISPYTIFKEVEKFVQHYSLPMPELSSSFHKQITTFGKKFPLQSTLLFGDDKPSAGTFINTVQREFETHFFDSLRKYLVSRTTTTNASFVRNLLNISVFDANEIFSVLVHGTK